MKLLLDRMGARASDLIIQKPENNGKKESPITPKTAKVIHQPYKD
jgi:hypothetical protein